MSKQKAPIIDWRRSDAKKVLLKDLEEGRLTLEATEVSAEQAWANYRHRQEFNNVQFNQFKARLKDHREQVKRRQAKSDDPNGRGNNAPSLIGAAATPKRSC